MRVIASVRSRGVEYQSIWASLSWIDEAKETSAAMALSVRSGPGTNEAIIRRNAKLPDVESALGALRALGLKDAQLSELFNHKGSPSRLAHHVKMLVSNLK